MIKAQQIERDGTRHGPVKEFTAEKWKRMQDAFGSKLRWEAINPPEPTKQEVVEFPEVFNDDPDDYPDPEGDLRDKLENMTKRMIISEYNLPKEDIKLNREDLINKVLKKE